MQARDIVEAGYKSAKTDSGRWRMEEIQLHFDGYAEPGYDASESGIVATGNWNDITHYDKESNEFVNDDDTPSRVARLLEHYGVTLEWSDEWDTCDNCGKLVRTQPDSYGWQKSYVGDCEIICLNCIDPEEHLESLEDEDNKANTLSHIDPAEYGYVLLDEKFEHGLHSGQNADPKVIASGLREKGIRRFLFNLDGVGQFDIDFSVYVHESEYKDDLLDDVETDGVDIAANTEKALKAASGVSSEDGKIAYTTIDTQTGTATTRQLTPEEFVNGVK